MAKVVSKGCLVGLALWDAKLHCTSGPLEVLKVSLHCCLDIVGGFALCVVLMM